MTDQSFQMVRIASIVEGHGDAIALPILLRRIAQEMIGVPYIDVLRPIRQPKSRIVGNFDGTLERAVTLAHRKLAASATAVDSREAILLLVDADEDCAAELARRLNDDGVGLCGGKGFLVVLPVVEFETWFVASADTLGELLDLSGGVPELPEDSRASKKWIADRFRKHRYSETIDQPKLADRIDLALSRRRSPSFDKLCRTLESLIK